jgi:hypothetical protein
MISGMKYWVLAGIMISGMTKYWVFGWRNAIHSRYHNANQTPSTSFQIS